MDHHMRAVMLAAKLYETRDTVQRLFGDRFAEVIEPHKATVRKAMALFKCGELAAIPRLFTAADEQGRSIGGELQMMLIAASVEIAEEK